MKLDLDLVKRILAHYESEPANEHPHPPGFDDVDRAVLLEHIELLAERRLLEAHIVRAGSGRERVYDANVERLTWEGHEFLQKAQDEKIWAQVKKLVKEKGGAASFDIVKALLTKLTLEQFGLSP